MEYTYHVFLLLGGIGLFLYGINFMSKSLYEALGDNLRDILEKLTTKPLNAFLLGVGVTALIQSSGATMVMVSGFVAAQLMTLNRGLLVIIGAAIGTTVTAQIIAFDIAPISPLIVFAGLILFQFINDRKIKRIGAVVLGFGLLFMGIYIMGEAIDRMSLGVLVKAFIDNFSNPVLAFIFGFIFTFIIQSSSASVGILQVMLASTALTDFNLSSVVFIIIGMNVGAVSPVVISSLSGNRAGRRAAIAAVAAKLVMSITFILLMLVWPGVIDLIANISGNVTRQIANFHLIFNVIGALISLPFVNLITNTIMKKLPDDPSESLYSRKLLYIGKGQEQTASVRIAQARQEIFRFADMVRDNYNKSIEAFFNADVDKAEQVKEHERTINYINREIYTYLLNLHGQLLPQNDYETLGRMFNILTDLERIGDHADNFADYAIIAVEHDATMSQTALEEITTMSQKTVEIVDSAIEAYKKRDFELMAKVQILEDVVDDLKDKLESNHIERMHKQACDPRGGTLFIDMISDFERVADHALNIAETLLGNDAPVKI